MDGGKKMKIYGVDYSKITLTELGVLFSLFKFRNEEKNNCFPSYRLLGETVGLSSRAISTSIKKLEKKKIITIKKKNRSRSNLYYFNENKINFEKFKIIKDEIYDDNDISNNARTLYIMLAGLSFEKEVSFPVYYFSKKYNFYWKTIDKIYNELIEKGYIEKIEGKFVRLLKYLPESNKAKNINKTTSKLKNPQKSTSKLIESSNSTKEVDDIIELAGTELEDFVNAMEKKNNKIKENYQSNEILTINEAKMWLLRQGVEEEELTKIVDLTNEDLILTYNLEPDGNAVKFSVVKMAYSKYLRESKRVPA
jgi:DNA-binding transcriptional regulator GbsR (MarR family)